MKEEIEKLSFEEAYRQLAEIVKKMEAGQMPLAESVAAYQTASELKKHLEKLLADAETKIEELKIESQ